MLEIGQDCIFSQAMSDTPKNLELTLKNMLIVMELVISQTIAVIILFQNLNPGKYCLLKHTFFPASFL
jgi:hypothetical protein